MGSKKCPEGAKVIALGPVDDSSTLPGGNSAIHEIGVVVVAGLALGGDIHHSLTDGVMVNVDAVAVDVTDIPAVVVCCLLIVRRQFAGEYIRET